MTRHERIPAIERPTVCPHCRQRLPGTSGIPIAEAVEMYGAHWGHKPEQRWISRRARELGCYVKVGKRAFVPVAAWNDFLEGRRYLGSDPHQALLALSDERPKRKWVYFIAAGDAVKIGSATDVRQRLRHLQTGSSETLKLVGLVDAASFQEWELQKRFSHLRLRGEWFRPALEMSRFIEENGA